MKIDMDRKTFRIPKTELKEFTRLYTRLKPSVLFFDMKYETEYHFVIEPILRW